LSHDLGVPLWLHFMFIDSLGFRLAHFAYLLPLSAISPTHAKLDASLGS